MTDETRTILSLQIGDERTAIAVGEPVEDVGKFVINCAPLLKAWWAAKQEPEAE